MKTFILLILLIFSGIAGAQPVKDLIVKAQALLGEKKFTEAIQVYNRAKQIDSTQYDLYTGRGTAYFELKEYENAFNDFSKAIAVRPDSALAYHYRANLLYTLLYTDEAILDNTKAIERATDDRFLLSCFVNRGSAKEQKRDFHGAYEDFIRAYSYDSSDVAIINNLGTVLDELGRRDEAIAFLKKAISIDSNFVGSYVNIGFQYTHLGRYQEALVYFDKALQLEKDEPLTLNNRGFAKYKMNDLTGALEDINKSLLVFRDNSYAYKNRALVHIAMEKTEEACEDLQMAKTLQFEKQYGPEVNDLIKKYCK
ncbi:MAG: tetratricopeptide repeat protein [Chitinophagales bacterium]|nr:tetratricopeptide repeat protein [Chitinophagales bacterium]